MAAGVWEPVEDHETARGPVHHQALPVVRRLGRGAKDTLASFPCRGHVLIPPGGPEIVHAIPGPSLLRVRSLLRRGGRFGAWAWRPGRPGRIVHHVLQFLAGLEIRDLLGGHFHPRAGFRVAADPGLSLASAETPESADLDLIAGAQGTNDTVENRLHNDLRFLPGHFHHP